MKSRVIIFIAAFYGFCAVALGAFGAHALRAYLESHKMTAVWHTAVQYEFYHALALLSLGIWVHTLGAEKRPWALRLTAWAWSLGVVLFSGSLYILALGGARWLDAITPLGGICFLIGWLGLMISACKRSSFA